MWHQQRAASGHIDNPALVSDCASGHPLNKTHPYGVSQTSGEVYTEEKHKWKSGKGQDVYNSCMKCQDSCKCQSMYDSSRTDSGFLSGSNIASDQCLSSDDINSSRRFTDSCLQDPPRSREDDPTWMKIDSGCDVGLSQEFSSLSLKNPSLNDLNTSPVRTQTGDSAFSNNNILSSATCRTSPNTAPALSPLPIPEQLQQPTKHTTSNWELYFQQDEDGDTQLHISIMEGFIEVVYSLIQMAPHPYFLDILNNVCQTPMHLAVLTRQPRIVRRLLVAGARVGIRDRYGNTALHLACQIGDVECVKALMEAVTTAETSAANLQYGACVQTSQDLEERNYDGQMCVHLAVLGGHVDVLRHLVWFGANINAREGKGGRTPLHYAVERSMPEVLQFLLEHCHVGLETVTYAGHTAYQLASCMETALAQELTAQLARKGAKPKHLPDDSESDSDYSDDEMRQVSNSFFKNHTFGGEPINIGA